MTSVRTLNPGDAGFAASERPVVDGVAARSCSTAFVWPAIYLSALALVAFWPVPVNQGFMGVLRDVSRAVPWLTYPTIEFVSNIVLFVPFGLILARALPSMRGLVLPLAFAATMMMETGQGLFLALRTPSLRDVVANVAGAAIGVAAVVVAERWRRIRVRD